MLTPEQFRVNEVWVVAKVNDSFLFVKDEPYDAYMLVDAASGHILGHVLSRVADGTPCEKDVEALLRKAWEAKNQWAEQLIIAGNSTAEDVFRTQAEKNGISVKIVPLSKLRRIIGPLKKALASSFMRGNA